MITRHQIAECAKTYVGVRFRMYGRDRKGVDCIGLLYCMALDLGIDVHDDRNYTRNPVPEKMQRVLDHYTNPAPMNPPMTGQVLKLRQFLFPMHFGILVIDGTQKFVVNANMKKGKVSIDTWGEWANLILENRDVKGVVG